MHQSATDVCMCDGYFVKKPLVFAQLSLYLSACVCVCACSILNLYIHAKSLVAVMKLSELGIYI